MTTALPFADRVQETTITSGTGTLTLAGAVTNYRTFDSAFTDGTSVFYTITQGATWEVGYGTFTHSGTTLSRNLLSSSTGSLISLTGGTANVWCDIPAAVAAASHNPQTFTSGGTYTPIITGYVLCIGWGGGGGGGSGSAQGAGQNGGGGGGGAIASTALCAVTAGTGVTVTIGTAGTGGAAQTTLSGNAGTAGGNTTFGSLATFPGASGGQGGATNVTYDTPGGEPVVGASGANVYSQTYDASGNIIGVAGMACGGASGSSSSAQPSSVGGANPYGGANGGAGGSRVSTFGGGGGGGGGPGGVGTAGTNGSSVTASAASNASANTGAGGGGGGGAGTTSGAGGNGGTGQLIVIPLG